jgi:GntR family transcriptional regulator, transcriptional repressor for pyruvate dehydrogenase complex
MTARIEPIKKSRLSEHVGNILLQMIKDKVFKPGDQLPSERELAEQFQVSRASIREALKIMEKTGYLESRVGVGGGTFVREITLDIIIDPFAEFLESEDNMVMEMLDFRLIIETEFARIAAVQRTAADLNAISASLDLMQLDIAAGGIGLAGDNGFHEAVARATHNNVFEKMLQMSKTLLNKTRETTLRLKNQPKSSLSDHRAIYQAIEEGDGDKAASLMHQHICKARENALISLRKAAALSEDKQTKNS